jgi:hydrophobe/amphiphile efflux-3 (HAE3) family protein
MSRILASLMAMATRRPVLVVVLTGVLAVAGGAFALLKLEAQTSSDTLVGRGTAEFEASADYAKRFGDDAVYVLVRQPAVQSALTNDLLRLIALEGCLSGALPRGQQPIGGMDGPCGQLARTKPAKVVFGPGTFINTSVGQIQDEFQRQIGAASTRANQVAEAARQVARRQGKSKAAQEKAAGAASQAVTNEFTLTYARLGLKYGLTAPPQLNDTKFVSQLVFDATKPPGTPKSRFAYIFPAKDAALIQVRLKPGLTTPARKQAIETIRAAVRMPDWRLPNGKGSYVVTGAPVVVADLTDSISRGIGVLLVGALLVMALVLAAVFRTRLRLLPLGVAVAATGMTFGLLALVGASLTIATIAVLPVLIGLAVDYAIQLQSRVQEEERAGHPIADAVQAVAQAGVPTVLTAATATAAGFLVLLLSPVPMVRGFGVLVVVGIAIAFVLTLTLGTAVLTLGDPTRPRRRIPGAALAAAVVPALRGARDLLVENPAGRAGARAGRALAARTRRVGHAAFALALARPGRVLAIGAAVAVVGWALDTQAGVESDIQRLVPQDLQALSDLRQLQDATGVGGEVDLVVKSDKLTEPATFAWMADYQQRVLRRAGYSAERGCGDANLCPALSLPDLFRGEAAKTKAGIESLLDAVPAYFSQGVITEDRKVASLAFGIRLMSVERQGEVIDAMREELDPPDGVTADLAGLPVLTAEANAKASSPVRRAGLLLAGLLAVGLVLVLALGSLRRAVLPLIPIALATGWTGVVLFVTRIELNPMSVTLGALVIAISTEFSVLLSERYHRERVGGHGSREALRRAYGSTGAAVLASGITAIAGFAVLVLSDIRMLRDFGAVTVVDLTVSLLGVLVVLPAVLVLDERGAFDDLGARARARLRRRAGGAGTGEPPRSRPAREPAAA